MGYRILRWAVLGLCVGITAASGAHAAETRGIQVVAKDPATGQSGEVALYRKSHAVIIGIDRYANLPPDRQLTFAVRDAKGVEEVLRRNYRFDAIHTLYDDEATKDKILKLLTADLPRTMTAEDSLLVFWAGHGNQEATRDGEIGYLIPHDGSSDAIYKNITMTEIRDTVSRVLPAKHVFYVIDACFGGLLVATRSVDPQVRRDLSYLREITKEPVRQVLTAGAKGQEVLDGGPRGHSVFTGRLIEVLEARGDFVTANEIQAILKEKVYGDAKGRGHTQTPSFGSLSGSGDYVFVPSAEHKLAERKAEQEKIAREIARTRAEQEKIKREIADAERLERDAQKARSEAEERKAREEVQRLEGLQRLAKIKEQELAEQKRRQEAEEAELRRIEAERQRRVEEARRQEEALREDEARRRLELARLEEDQARQRWEEAERLAALKRELDAKRQQALAVADVLSIDAAVAEIKTQSARIDEIRAEFEAERKRQEAGIQEQYKKKMALLDKARDERRAVAAKAPKTPAEEPAALLIPPKDEFETQAEYQARVDKAKADEAERRRKAQAVHDQLRQAEEESYRQAAAEATRQRDQALQGLGTRIEAETRAAIAPFQERVATLANKEYTVTGEDLLLEIGTYDAETERFPISITSKAKGVQVAVNGTLPLPRDAARGFRQHYTSGLVRAEATVRAGDGKLVGAAVINEIEEARHQYSAGDFLTAEERQRFTGNLVCLQGGSFEMGDVFGGGNKDETPVRTLLVSDFCIGQAEITQDQWQLVMGSNPSRFKGADRPVESVSWNDVQEFLNQLSEKMGKYYRLPTEAEWEYAARSGGKEQEWAGTSKEDSLGDYAWYGANSGGQTQRVGQKRPNDLGLHDMSGNVAEWCQDWYGGYLVSAEGELGGPASGSQRVIRGGSWDRVAGYARAVARSHAYPDYGYGFLGFRIATDP